MEPNQQNLQQQIQQLKVRNEELEAKQRRASKGIHDFYQEKQKYKEQNQTLIGEVHELVNEMGRLYDEVDEFKNKVKSLEKKLEDQQEEIENLNQALIQYLPQNEQSENPINLGQILSQQPSEQQSEYDNNDNQD